MSSGKQRMSSREAAARRARRLLRWYPRAWRSRYGEEFTELLISEIGERPRSPARTADVIRGGIVTRLADRCVSPTIAYRRGSVFTQAATPLPASRNMNNRPASGADGR